MKSRVICTKDVDWRIVQIIQPKNFKDQTDFEKEKLITSLLNNEVVSAIYVWEDADGILWCLDGKHRIDAYYELVKRGHDVPAMIPATFIAAANKKEAAKLVLLYSSGYAAATHMGFIEFLKVYELDLSGLNSEISIPGIDLAEVDFLMHPNENELIREAKAKPHTIKITFPDIKQLEAGKKDVEQLLADKYPGAIYSLSSGEV